MNSILNYTASQLQELCLELGFKPYRSKQLFQWIYRKRVASFEAMSDLSLEMRQQLTETYSLSTLKQVTKQVASDGTVKYLFACQDNSLIETVLMRHDYGISVCVTSQVGCNMACTFCASGLLKKTRNLECAELVDQVLSVQRELDQDNLRISHIVVMGIGEPFDNYDNVMNFIRVINDDNGLAIGARHITVSTCGVVPMIRRFAQEQTQVNLAISLHAPNDGLRSELMPINKAYPLAQLFDAIDEYSRLNNRKVTFEYILLKDINDRVADAIELAQLVKHRNAYVNLIPYNPVSEHGYQKSDVKTSMRFFDTLMKNKVKATLRHELGSDINAACGQLRANYESKGKQTHGMVD